MSHATTSDGFFKDGVSNGLDTERYVGLMSRTYRRFRRDISRADFQALAAIVAVEMAVEENNAFCAEDTRVRIEAYYYCCWRSHKVGAGSITIDYGGGPVGFSDIQASGGKNNR